MFHVDNERLCAKLIYSGLMSCIINVVFFSAYLSRLQEQLLANILHDNPEWWDAIRLRTREILQAKDGSGVLDISMDELSAKLIVTRKEAVSDEVKKSTLLEIQNQLTHKQKESCR